MTRITEHSKTTFFKDSDVMVNGKRLGPAAFESEVFYKHYVDIINRLAELEDRYCNTPQTHADQLRAKTDEELAEWIAGIYPDCPPGFSPAPLGCDDVCRECWLDWLRQEADT